MTAIRGIAQDSTYAVQLDEYFIRAGPTLTNEQLRQSLTIPVGDPGGRRLYSKVNDLGKPQFILTSFRMFGVSLRAPHYLFFALLGASLLLFVAAHARDPDALCLSLFVVLSFYAMTFLLGLSSQLWTVIDVRFLSALAILPCLHARAGRQLPALVVASAVAVRSAGGAHRRGVSTQSSAVWTIVCVVAVAGWTVGGPGSAGGRPWPRRPFR